MLQTLALSALSFRPPPPTGGAEGLSVAYFAFGANMATSVLTGRRGVVPLDAAEWQLVLHASWPVIALDEILKFLTRRKLASGGSSGGSYARVLATPSKSAMAAEEKAV